MRIQEKVDQAYADANQANTAVAKLESALNAKNDRTYFSPRAPLTTNGEDTGTFTAISGRGQG